MVAPNSFAPIVSEDRQSGVFPWPWNMFGPKEKPIPLTIKKYPEHPGAIDLAAALQYDTAQGSVQLREIIKAFTRRAYQPAYEDWETLMHMGNTDA